MHQLSQPEKRIKAATFRAIKSIGGIEAAAEFVRVGKSALHTYYSVHHPECFAPLDVASDLDEQAGYPFIAEALQQAFSPIANKPTNPHELLSRVIAESGELGALFSASLADGHVCPDEAARIQKEAEDLKAAAQHIIDKMAALQVERAA